MPKCKLQITDRILSIYTEKYFGEKLRIIQQRYNVKCHSAIYFYCSIVEERSVFSKSLREKIKNRKNEYRSKIGTNREARESNPRT